MSFLSLQRSKPRSFTLTADRSLTIRLGSHTDAQACAKICYEAFKAISEQHGFSSTFATLETTQNTISTLFSRPNVYSVVAEIAGQIVGSSFLWERSTIAGIAPITVAPHIQNSNVGRRLMESVLERAQQQRFAGVRLVQDTFHNRSLSLYAKLGFEVQEPLALLQGAALGLKIPGYAVRPAIKADLGACNRLCWQIHGFDRGQELLQAIQEQTATVVEHQARITGYATQIGFYGHAVGESNEDLKALMGAAKAFEAPGIILPTRNSDLFRWCLHNGLRIVQPMTLMSFGLYNPPTGAFLPSILF